jgi:hypothetical protein
MQVRNWLATPGIIQYDPIHPASRG